MENENKKIELNENRDGKDFITQINLKCLEWAFNIETEKTLSNILAKAKIIKDFILEK